jgi:3-hydroxy-9,10-secoandrosta-1,3,5(10)-triene-9,17-dione monooxygenase
MVPPMTDKASLLIERARALAPLLAEHAAEAERQRKPHDAVIAALEEAEIFKMMVPQKYGGFELDLDTFLEVGLALAEGDASMAWVTTFYIEHCWMLSHFPEAFQERVFGERSYVLAPASILPSGGAVPVDGGYCLSGRWQWGTGAMHADWVLVGSRVIHDDADILDMRFFAMRAEDVTIDDTWYVDGMQGTGSNDIVVDDLIVPEEQTASLIEIGEGRGIGGKLYEGPLYRTPMIPILGLAAAMPAVGQAKAAVQRFREHMTDRILYGTLTKQSDRPAAQIRLARAAIEAHQAELLLRSVVKDVMALRERATRADRSRWVSSYAYAVDQCKRVLQSVAEASGAHAHFQSHPLQRAVRDINTMACHALFDLDSRLENHGRTMLGLEPEGLL